MASYIHVPKPCHEDWNNMLPEAQGKHCLQCCKTVVDFTGWEVPSITAYLEANAQQGVCGRFNTSQLETPVMESNSQVIQQVFRSHLSLAKKIAAIIIIVFGLGTASCTEPQILGVARVPPRALMGDTILLPDSMHIQGSPAVCQPPDSTHQP